MAQKKKRAAGKAVLVTVLVLAALLFLFPDRKSVV